MKTKKIKDFERYTISDSGIVFNSETNHTLCLKNNNGYKQVVLVYNGKRKTFNVHRLVALSFIPNPENKPVVNHINGIRDDNNIENLEWVTYKENAVHAFEYLTKHIRRGVKLTQSDVINIRMMYIPKIITYKQIALKFNISAETVRDIINNRIWKNIWPYNTLFFD